MPKLVRNYTKKPIIQRSTLYHQINFPQKTQQYPINLRKFSKFWYNKAHKKEKKRIYLKREKNNCIYSIKKKKEKRNNKGLFGLDYLKSFRQSGWKCLSIWSQLKFKPWQWWFCSGVRRWRCFVVRYKAKPWGCSFRAFKNAVRWHSNMDTYFNRKQQIWILIF